MRSCRRPLYVPISLLILLAAGSVEAGSGRGTTIEDFETPGLVLQSYPDQDAEPDAWERTSANTYGGSSGALRMYGNTWKTQTIAPIAISDSTVWQLAVHVERRGEMQAFGIGDGTNELLYTFAGEQLPEDPEWWTVYQGAYPLEEWHVYLLPIGKDWLATHGSLPTIEQLIYVNDDDSGASGIIVFDEISDVTADLPVPPQVQIQHTIEKQQQLSKNLYRIDAQFMAAVSDPDSDTHSFWWDFGDSTSSTVQNPSHQFLVQADYTYTVSVIVTDGDGLAGGDTSQIWVEPGPGGLPLTVNFVGDVFTGRQFESSGGIIDTQGIEALFEPTLGIFGQAADVNVCNLECAYTDQGTPHPTKSVVFRSRPENIVGIQYAGVDLVTLGNNHIIDYDEPGMLQTMQLLDDMQIRYSGAGVNATFALQPTFWTEKGVRIAFLGQCNRTGRQWNYQPFLDAGASKPGFGHLLPQNLADAVDQARPLADIVVLQLHSGDEYETAPPGREASFERPPPVEADVLTAEDPEFLFRVEPTPGDRTLRRQAADFGADVVINHHPHVLQGFESYGGKLIAHSLGNFIFDLYYPETMPTIVLTLEMDKNGITGYSFVPAWIDDYIPRPASGQLGREIMDRLADYSRPMNSLVSVNAADSRARVYLDRSATDSVVVFGLLSSELRASGDAFTTPPLLLDSWGNLSQITEIAGDVAATWQVRYGREILWHGGFEDEGATFWDVNTADEWLDDTISHSGERALAVRRSSGDSDQTGTDLEKHLPCDPAKEHSAAGYLKADNAAEARIMARFYSNRYSESHLSSDDLAARFSGTIDWTYQWLDLQTPEDAIYFELRCAQEPPNGGTGLAWFDDLVLIEWEPWVSLAGPLTIAAPNNYRALQVRTTTPGTETVTVSYAETAYGPRPTVVGNPLPAPRRMRLVNHPNPFNPRTTIELTLPGGSGALPVVVDIYDLRGRKVRSLFQGSLPAGQRHGFSWDGLDDRGHASPSGVYLTRARWGDEVLSHKMLLLR